MESIKLHPAIDSLNLSKDIKEKIQIAYNDYKADFEEKQKTNPNLKLKEINFISLTFSLPSTFFNTKEKEDGFNHLLLSKNQIEYIPNIGNNSIDVENRPITVIPKDFLRWGDTSTNTLEGRLINGLVEHIAKNYCEVDLAKIIVKQLFPLDSFIYDYTDDIIQRKLNRFKVKNGDMYSKGHYFIDNSNRVKESYTKWFDIFAHFIYKGCVCKSLYGDAISIDGSVLKDYYSYLTDILNTQCTKVFFKTYSEYRYGSWENNNGHLIIEIVLDDDIAETAYSHLYETMLNQAISNVDKFFSYVKGFTFNTINSTLKVEKGKSADLVKRLYEYLKEENDKGNHLIMDVDIELYKGIVNTDDQYIPITFKVQPILLPHKQPINQPIETDNIDEWLEIVKSDKFRDSVKNEKLKDILYTQLKIFDSISSSYRPEYPADKAFRELREHIGELQRNISEFIGCLKQ